MLLDHQSTLTPMAAARQHPYSPQQQDSGNDAIEEILRKQIEETNQKIYAYFQQQQAIQGTLETNQRLSRDRTPPRNEV